MDAPRNIADAGESLIDADVDERMLSLARMGKGLATELVPLLTVLSNILQLTEVGLRKGDPVRKAAIASLSTADRAMDSATMLVRRLEAFGSTSSGRAEITDLGTWVESLVPRLQTVLGNGVSIDVCIPAHEVPVDIDAGRFEQVFVELAKNSGDAMRGSGRFTILVESAWHDASGDGVARIVVEDSGPGMDSESSRRAIEPFFTKKHHDLGIGLGLSIAHTVVRSVGGRLSVPSRMGSGFQVVIDLPISTDPVTE